MYQDYSEQEAAEREMDVLHAKIATLEAANAELTTERDEWKREYDLEQQEKVRLHTALNQANAERDNARDDATVTAENLTVARAVIAVLRTSLREVVDVFGSPMDYGSTFEQSVIVSAKRALDDTEEGTLRPADDPKLYPDPTHDPGGLTPLSEKPETENS